MLKEIEEFEDYQISDDGRVWSKKSNKWLKSYMDRGGYFFVCLYKDGVNHNKRVHRLIAEAFIPNPDNKPCIDHINTVKTDNRVENLRWVSYKENNNNPITMKKYCETHKGKNFIKKKLKTVYQYTLDGKLVKKWKSATDAELKGLKGFTNSGISMCCRGKLKKHKGFKWSYNSI